MQIKICGLKRMEDVDSVNHAGPDYAGFVFAGTKRKIDFEQARRLKEAMHPDIRTVGVFVNADIDYVKQLVEQRILDVVQLHGEEKPAYIETLKKELAHIHCPVPIIKAVRVQSTEQIMEADTLPVDYLLLDAFKPDEYGGSGKVFDHQLIPHLTKPYILAGGISSGNVVAILDVLATQNKLPICVDVSSSVETDGFKDRGKINEIVKLVHTL